MLCANPAAKLPVWLKSDAEAPMESRPIFRIRPLTAQELSDGAKFHSDARLPATGNDKCRELLESAIAIGLVGWENVVFRGQPVPYSPQTRVGGFLAAEELWELADLVLNGQALSEADRGNSSAPSTTVVGGSAPSAEPKAAV